MHFHLPKPLHGWREFVGEVGIIVIGVLIALGAESLLEDWRWRHQVEQADSAFKAELLSSAGSAYERLAIQPCLQARLRALSTALNSASRDWHAIPEMFNGAGKWYATIMPVVYRPPSRSVPSDPWRNALANGTINHLKPHQSEALSAAYATVDQFQDYQAEEGSTETNLSPLGFDRPLDQRARMEMLQTIARLDLLNSRLMLSSRDMFEAIRASHLGITRREAEQVRRSTIQLQQGYRGSCVRTDLPFDVVDR